MVRPYMLSGRTEREREWGHPTGDRSILAAKFKSDPTVTDNVLGLTTLWWEPPLVCNRTDDFLRIYEQLRQV